jgi:hypothetical protein
MSDVPRICQFFLRGRCSRQKCEFRHPGEREFQAIRERERERERKADNNASFVHLMGCIGLFGIFNDFPVSDRIVMAGYPARNWYWYLPDIHISLIKFF